MAYNKYLSTLNNYNNQELQIESLVNQDKQEYHEKIEEQISKWADLALGVHGSAEMLKGLQGIYGKYKEKALKKLKNISDKDLDDIGLNSERIKPFQKVIEMKDMGGREISPEEISRVRTGEQFRDVIPDYDERRLPADITPEDVETAPVIDPMEGLSGRVARQKALFPEYFEPKFEGPVAPSGFGSSEEVVKPRLRSWDQTRFSNMPSQEPEGLPLDPALERARVQDQPFKITRTERMEARARYNEAQRVRRAKEPDFKHHAPSQGEDEYQRGVKSELSDQYAKVENLEPLPEPPKTLSDILPDIEDIPSQFPAELPRGAPIVIQEEEAFQPQGYRISRVLMKAKKTVKQPVRQPEPERPLTPSQEIQPVREEPIRAPTPSQEIQPVREGDIAPVEKAPRVVKGFQEMDEAPSISKVGETVATDVGEDLVEDTALNALDAVPIVGQLAGLGMGIYALVEAFKPHHAPVEKITPTGVAFDPEGEMGASGYV